MFSIFNKKAAAPVAVPDKAGPAFVVPEKLPALRAKTGADLAQWGDFKAAPHSPAAESLSPSQFLSAALNRKQEAVPATRAIARAMPETHAVQWAVDSSKSVADKLSDPDRAALASAEKYLSEPSPATQRAAAAAAAKTDFQGPGAWSAKAASLVGMAPSTPPAAASAATKAPPAPGPVAECVAGAVILAAVLSIAKSKPAAGPTSIGAPSASSPSTATPSIATPASPQEAQQLNQALKPLIEHGLELTTKL